MSNRPFLDTVFELLNSTKETVILCPNTIDMMRYRLLFHEAFRNRKKTIFRANLYTPNIWMRKTLFDTEGSEKVILKETPYKAVLWQLFRNKSFCSGLKSLEPIVALPGFLRELLRLWRTYQWFGKSSSLFHDLNSEFSAESYEDIFLIFRELEDSIERAGYRHLADFLYSYENSKPAEKNLQVIYLFPTHLSIADKKTLEFLAKTHGGCWTFLLKPDFSEKIRQFIEERISPYCSLNPLYVETESAKDVEPTIYKTSTVYEEAAEAAKKIHRLLEENVAPHEIVVHYNRPEEAAALQLSLAPYGIALDCPEGGAALSEPASFLFYSLVRLLESHKSGFSPTLICDILLNPSLNSKAFFSVEISSAKLAFLDALFKSVFDPEEKLSLQEIIHTIKDLSLSNDSEKLTLSYAIKGLKRLNQNFPDHAAPSDYAELLSDLLLRYVRKEENYQKSLEKAGKFLNEIAQLDTFFPNGIDLATVFTLIRDEYEKSAKPLENPELAEKTPHKISARDIQEGLHSPASHLFCMGLSSGAFPVHFQNSGIISDKDSSRNYILQRNFSEQKELFSQSLKMAEDGIFLSYSTDRDPMPSAVILDILKKQSPESSLDELAQSIPSTLPDLSIFRNGEMRYRHFLQIKFTEENEESYSPYFGKIYKTDTEISSAGALETLASCPQRYWFRSVLNVRDITGAETDRPFDPIDKGNLFHEASRYFIEDIQKTWPETNYKNLPVAPSQEKIQKAFNTALEKSGRLDRRSHLLTNAVIEDMKNLFTGYFTHFLQSCRSEKHPLSFYYPLAVEQSFENLSFGPFTLKGRIDRIDISKEENKIFVLDYKTAGSSPRYVNRDNNESLIYAQLPAYIKAAAGLPGICDKSDLQIQAAYVFPLSARPGSELAVLKKEYTVADAQNEMFFEPYRPALNALENIQKTGFYFTAPQNYGGRWLGPCRYCDYAIACDRLPYDVNLQRLEKGRAEEYKLAIHDRKKYS